MDGFKYVKIPVSMIPLLSKGKNGLLEVALYCVYRTCMQFGFDADNVAKRLVYEYHITEPEKRRTKIPDELANLLITLEEETDYRAKRAKLDRKIKTNFKEEIHEEQPTSNKKKKKKKKNKSNEEKPIVVNIEAYNNVLVEKENRKTIKILAVRDGADRI